MIERSERIRCGDILRNDWCSDANPNRYTMYIGRDDRFFIGINYKGKRVRHYIDQNKIVRVGHIDEYDALISKLRTLDHSADSEDRGRREEDG